METYCDLNTFLRKPLIFKGLNKVGKDGQAIEGKKFIIPGQIPVKFMIKLDDYIKEQDDISKGKIKVTDEEMSKKLKDMVLEIINLDHKNKYTMKDVDENFDDLIVLNKIVEQFINYAYMIKSDPNSNSPISK